MKWVTFENIKNLKIIDHDLEVLEFIKNKNLFK